MMKHLLALVAAIALCSIATTAAATAVGPEDHCDLDIIATGEHPCLDFVQVRYNVCAVEAINRCDDTTASLALQNYLIGNSIVPYEIPPSTSRRLADLYENTQQAGHEDILAWSDETRDPPLRGKISVRVSSFEAGGTLDDDVVCAATAPRTPATPLTGLLPLLLGAFILRRHTASQTKSSQ
jgi:hypothetical protein